MSEDVGRLREVAEAATPGPWEAAGWLWLEEAADEDARHACTFDPPTALALLDRLEAAEAKVARVRDVVDRLADDDLRYDTSYGAAGQMYLLDDLRAALSAPQTADAPEGHGDAGEAGGGL